MAAFQFQTLSMDAFRSSDLDGSVVPGFLRLLRSKRATKSPVCLSEGGYRPSAVRGRFYNGFSRQKKEKKKESSPF